jgi:serine/threonine protein kinase
MHYFIDFNDIVLNDKIHESELSVIYEGEYNGHEVAVKIFNPVFVDVQAFKEEFQLLRYPVHALALTRPGLVGGSLANRHGFLSTASTIRSPHMVFFYGLCVEPKICVVMELCKGTMEEYLTNRFVAFYECGDGHSIGLLASHDHDLITTMHASGRRRSTGRSSSSWARRSLPHSRCCITKISRSCTRPSAPRTFWYHVASLRSWWPHGAPRSSLTLPGIQMTGYWQLKMGDFGRLRYNSKGKRITSTYDEMAMAYSPPETLVQGDSSDKGDVYSAAIVLWEMAARTLTGMPALQCNLHAHVASKQIPPPDAGRYIEPYEGAVSRGATSYEKMSAIVKQNLRPQKLNDMHPDLWKLLQRAWHTDPDQRPTSRGTFVLCRIIMSDDYLPLLAHRIL